MAHLCTLMGVRHSPRTAFSPWTNGLVEVQNRNLGTHSRMFLHNTPKDCALQGSRFEKNLSVADMLRRYFTKAELHINQFKQKILPKQIGFAILQDNTLKPVHYLIEHEQVLPHQKHDSHPFLVGSVTDQFPIRINDKGNDNIVKPLNYFSFKSVTPFQTKFKTPVKKNNKSHHRQSLLLNDSDFTSDDEEHISTRIPIQLFLMTILYMKKLSPL